MSDRSQATNGRPPHVLFAIGTLGIGGSENQLTQFLVRAHPAQLRATVVTWGKSDPQLPNEQLVSAAGVERRRLGFGDMPRTLQGPLVALRSDRLLRELQPDLVYCWLESSSLLFCPPARAQRIPVLVARRNVEGAPVERVPAFSWAIRQTERMATLVTGNSDAVVATAIERGIPESRVRLVQNGHPSLPALPPPAGPTVSLGYVAAFRREKGHLRLLDVLSRVHTEVPWRVDLAGNGPLMREVQRAADARGLSERVRFVGVVRDVRNFWGTHHVAVLLSDSEGSPNALIEAAIAGRPIVATDVGGAADVVSPGGGLLVPVNDLNASAAALTRLIEDAQLRRRLGQQAHKQATKRFSIDTSVEQHLGIIHEALGRARTEGAKLRSGQPRGPARGLARNGSQSAESRVLVLTPYPYGKVAGPRSSFELWEPVLADAGIRLDYAVFETDRLYEILLQPGRTPSKSLEMVRSYLRYLPQVGRSGNYDAILINREAALVGPAVLERWVAAMGKPIIYQLDDPLYVPYRSSVNGVLSYLKFFSKVATICRLSTVVIANSSDHVAYAQRYNGNVWQIPSVVDGRVFSYRGPGSRTSDGPVCIGWTGSHTTIANLRMIRRPLAEIAARDGIHLRFVGAKDFGLNGVPHEARPWDSRTEVDDIRSFDVGLLPVPDTPWSRRKFYLKLVQYMALGIPTVATPIGSNLEVLEPGVTGLFARNDQEWLSALNCLVDDHDLRCEMGTRAAEIAHARYTLQANAERIVAAFRSAIGTRPR